jgi:hypothetical protein
MTTDIERCCIYGGICPANFDKLSGCDTVMNAYCSVGDRFATSGPCKQWIAKDTRKAADVLMSSKCTADALGTYPDCITWCSKVENAGKCDNASREFCNRPDNYDNDFCQCLLAPTTIKGNVKCIWNPCIQASNPYLTALMGGICPDIIDCSQLIDLRGASDNILLNVKQAQSCNLSKDAKTDTTNITTPAPVTPLPNKEEKITITDNDDDYTVILGIVGLLFLILLLITSLVIAYILNNKAKKTKQPTAPSSIV